MMFGLRFLPQVEEKSIMQLTSYRLLFKSNWEAFVQVVLVATMLLPTVGCGRRTGEISGEATIMENPFRVAC